MWLEGHDFLIGGVGVAADHRISNFACRRTPIFIKQC